MGSNYPGNPLDNPATWKNTGNEFFSRHDYESAIKCYTHAIEINPTYIDAWNNLGYTLLKAGRIDEAKEIDYRIRELKSRSTTRPYWGSDLGVTIDSFRSVLIAVVIWVVLTFLLTTFVVLVTGITGLAPLFAIIFGLIVFFGIVFFRIVAS